MTPTLLCVGLAVVDVVADLAGPLEPGAKQFVPALRTAFGGPATTAAAAAARLGVAARLVAPVGDDARAEELRTGLTEAGVAVDGLVVRRGVATATSLVLVTPDGERTIVNATPDGLRGPLGPEAAARLRAAAADADAVLADVRWPAAAALALSAARAAGRPAVLDLDRVPAAELGLVAGLVRAASHVAASRDGLDDLLARHAPGLRVGADPAAALAALRDLTDGATVVVTLGAEGAAWLDGDGALQRAAAPAVDAVETLGAGDVWHGAFAAAVAAGRPVPDAVGDANAAAALRCARRGGWATLPDAAEVAALRAGPGRDPGEGRR